MAELPLKVAEFRARHRERNISPGYRGWLHFTTTTIGAAAVIAFCAWRIDTPSAGELAMIPVFFLFSNLVEYLGHRGPMHNRRAGLAILFRNPRLADVALLKMVDDPTPIAGDTITYTVVARNVGQVDALGVQVTDVLPPGLTLVSAVPSGGTFAAGVWSVPPLALRNSGKYLPLVFSVTLYPASWLLTTFCNTAPAFERTVTCAFATGPSPTLPSTTTSMSASGSAPIGAGSAAPTDAVSASSPPHPCSAKPSKSGTRIFGA